MPQAPSDKTSAGAPLQAPLLTTKLYIPPVRLNRVSRPRLLERLTQGLGSRLTLVSAPAGFGKTTLVSAWLAECQHPAAWVSLDAADNDPVRFLGYVIAAVQTTTPEIGKTAQGLLHLPQPPPIESILTVLVNDLSSLSDDLVLVLDDYHVIDAAAVHNSLTFLLDHLPPQVRLIIVTRADPPLPLARLRALDQLAEIRAGHLRFTLDETATFLQQVMGLNLSAEDAAALEARTEGWIAGLQLAALSLQGHDAQRASDFIAAFTGSHHYIVDYLAEEVLNRQPTSVKDFLLQTSILERMTGPLCDAVVGETNALTDGVDGQATLEELERANLFVTALDDERRWYRYHHLFGDLLRKRLRQSAGAQTLALLHRRASEWCEREGYIAEAVSHALAGPDWERAATLIERYAPDIASRGENVLVRSWLKALPLDIARSNPFVCLLCASLETSPPVEEQWLQDAQAAWKTRMERIGESVAVDRVTQAHFNGWMISLRIELSFERGESLQEIIESSREALAYIPEDDLIYNLRARCDIFRVLGLAHWCLDDLQAANQAFVEARRIGVAIEHFNTTIGAAFYQARIARRCGQLRQAAAICRETLQSIVEPSEQAGRLLPDAGGLYIVLGCILLEWNDLQEADRALAKGLELMRLRGATWTDSYVGLARLRHAQGNTAEAFDLLDQWEQWVIKIAPPAAGLVLSQTEIDDLVPTNRLVVWANSEAAALRVKFWLSQAEDDPGCLTLAARFVDERSIRLDCKEQWNDEGFALGRLLIAQYGASRALSASESPDLQPLVEFLNRQFQAAQENGGTKWIIEVLILQAMVWQVQGETDQAIATLQEALVLAEPEGFVRLFVEQGQPMAHLLYQAAGRGISPEYVGKLLTAFPAAEMTPTDWAGSSKRKLPEIEPLSEREIQVLRLVAEGLSNRGIARRLFLSPNTVRIHTSNIYGKLGVHNRTQAVAQARSLGLV